MRGKGLFGIEPDAGKGITPAHAGKSLYRIYTLRDLGDHPRTCGEKKEGEIGDLPITGSPPHMRGKVVIA